jgi:CubicO group peptidase (beta-lactamase class C family)
VLDAMFSRACEEAAARFDVPALVVGVCSSDGVTKLHGVGCEPDTRFLVASVTKPMTATLAARVLDLEATTGVWPEDVRVRHLLAHTSGFAGEHGDLARFGDGDDALGSVVAELPTVRRLLPVDRVWSYANSGYWLAGWLAAEAAGTSFEEALHRHVLGPAGMASSGFDEPDLEGTGKLARPMPYPRARRPSGGLVTDATDLIRFGRWQLAEPWTEVLRRPYARPVSGVYGYGFAGQRVAGVDVWGHPGSAWGFQASLLVVPGRGAVFAGLTNSDIGSKALTELEDLWFERVIGARRPVAETVALSPSALQAFAATYANDDLTVTLEVDGDRLAGQLASGGDAVAVVARPIGERRFEVVGGPRDRERFDFPLNGFIRVGSTLLERVA